MSVSAECSILSALSVNDARLRASATFPTKTEYQYRSVIPRDGIKNQKPEGKKEKPKHEGKCCARERR